MSNQQTLDSNQKDLEYTIESLFNEITEDLAETMNGGLNFSKGACHGQMVL